MKLKFFPALLALLWCSCGGSPTEPVEDDVDPRKHFVNYSASYADEPLPPSESFAFKRYPHIGRAFDSAQAFFDSTMGENDPITIYIQLGEGRFNQCAGDHPGTVACAEKGRRRIIITERNPFNLVHGSFEWWRMIIIHETFHDLGFEEHWHPPRGTVMDEYPRSDEVHPYTWEVMRQNGWIVNE